VVLIGIYVENLIRICFAVCDVLPDHYIAIAAIISWIYCDQFLLSVLILSGAEMSEKKRKKKQKITLQDTLREVLQPEQPGYVYFDANLCFLNFVVAY